MNERNDMVLFPPSITKFTIPAGASHPSSGSYYLSNDAIYVVISGNGTFGTDTDDEQLVHSYGDAFWVLAGASHGPITNVGTTDLVVTVTAGAATSALTMRTNELDGTPSDDNPSVDSTQTTMRSYRQVDASWTKNPSDHTDECLANGGVYNMGFDAVDNTPPLLRVRWGANCSIPYHYHPTGALYYVQYGTMYFDGDYPSSDPMSETGFEAGDVRWVRPGFDYGPEYNGAEDMEITVLGVDTNPEFQAPPDGPYKVQKATTCSHVYD